MPPEVLSSELDPESEVLVPEVPDPEVVSVVSEGIVVDEGPVLESRPGPVTSLVDAPAVVSRLVEGRVVVPGLVSASV
ncbi:MAG: hypothetical protein KDK70_43790, partial [Myxococcales bacterium]|nr:hypothetical protein [Myxococcales bacterium]